MARRISITVRPNSRVAQITQLGGSDYSATVCAPAHRGAANAAVLELLARHFSVPKSQIQILRGHGSRRKLVQLPD